MEWRARFLRMIGNDGVDELRARVWRRRLNDLTQWMRDELKSTTAHLRLDQERKR